MRKLHLFEFCDQSWVPESMRKCLFELMEFCFTFFRAFYRHTAHEALRECKSRGFSRIIEFGAGRAPITRQVASNEHLESILLVPCDIAPNREAFQELESRYPKTVRPIYDPVDLTCPNISAEDALGVVSGAFHHVPPKQRALVIRHLTESCGGVAVFEPLRPTALSILVTLFAFFPAIWIPLAYWQRPGRWRRVFWCWCVPLVPFAFTFDGVVSCLRQWSQREWIGALECVLGADNRNYRICESVQSIAVFWSASKLGACEKDIPGAAEPTDHASAPDLGNR